MIFKNKNPYRYSMAFTLAEVLITLAIIGVVASLTIPQLINAYQERQFVTGLLKFNSTLQQAVQLWKQDIGCYSDAYTCLSIQGLPDANPSNFDQIAKFMNVSSVATTYTQRNSADWLPSDTLNYYGDTETKSFGKVAKVGSYDVAYLLQDGTTFSMDVGQTGFGMYVDVNGKNPPNRMGKDVFPIILGMIKGKDIYPFAYYSVGAHNTQGLCARGSYACNPDNIDPTKYNGASPTSYVLLHHKLPDFKELSKTVPGFKE